MNALSSKKDFNSLSLTFMSTWPYLPTEMVPGAAWFDTPIIIGLFFGMFIRFPLVGTVTYFIFAYLYGHMVGIFENGITYFGMRIMICAFFEIIAIIISYKIRIRHLLSFKYAMAFTLKVLFVLLFVWGICIGHEFLARTMLNLIITYISLIFLLLCSWFLFWNDVNTQFTNITSAAGSQTGDNIIMYNKFDEHETDTSDIGLKGGKVIADRRAIVFFNDIYGLHTFLGVLSLMLCVALIIFFFGIQWVYWDLSFIAALCSFIGTLIVFIMLYIWIMFKESDVAKQSMIDGTRVVHPNNYGKKLP